MPSKVLPNSEPIEIEKKFLIKLPDISILESQKNYSSSVIEQAYISTDGIREGGRIRKREFADGCRYYKTFKDDISSISRIEIESEISRGEYEALMKNRLDGTRVINKVRHCFEFEDQLLELDIYSFWNDRATLEIELESEEQEVVLPDFIEVIADVSSDKNYSNFALAHNKSE